MRRARLTVHVSTKLNRSHVVTGAPRADPAHPGPHRHATSRRGGEQFVTVEDSMGMVHASRGNLDPGQSRTCSPRSRSSPGSPAPSSAAESAVALGGLREGLRHHPRPHRPRGPRLRGLQRPRGRPGGFALPHAPRDERRFPTATGKANFTAAPVEYPELPDGPAAAADAALARPVQHHDLRPRRPLPRHQERPPRRPGQPRGRRGPRARRRLVRRPRQRVDRTASSGAPPASGSCTTPPPAAAPPPTTRRPTCWSRWTRPPTPATPPPASPVVVRLEQSATA